MIDEAWECQFLIREVLFVRSRLQKGSESENEIQIKNDYITLAWDKDKKVIRGKIKILSKALSSPYEIKERARESLHLVVELTKEKINAGFGHLEIKPVIEIDEPELINKDALFNAGQQTYADLRCHQAVIAELNYITTDKNAGIADIIKKHNKIYSKNPEFILAVKWFFRSTTSVDPVDAFINSWITYNMLYGWLTQASNHVQGIKGLTGKGIPRIQQQKELVLKHNELLEELSRLHLIDRHHIDRTEKLRHALSGQKPKEILIGAIDAIGCIRHNIFHGSHKDKTQEAQLCFPFLNDLNKRIIISQLDKH